MPLAPSCPSRLGWNPRAPVCGWRVPAADEDCGHRPLCRQLSPPNPTISLCINISGTPLISTQLSGPLPVDSHFSAPLVTTAPWTGRLCSSLSSSGRLCSSLSSSFSPEATPVRLYTSAFHQNCSFVQVSRGLSGVRSRASFCLHNHPSWSFPPLKTVPSSPGVQGPGRLAPPPSIPTSQAAPSERLLPVTPHPLTLWARGTILSALVSVVSSMPALEASGCRLLSGLRPDPPRHPPSHPVTSHLVLGLRLCSGSGPERPPSDGPLLTPSPGRFAAVSASQWELPGRDPFFLPGFLVLSRSNHHRAYFPSTFLFASCLLPLLEHKQEGRYFYLSDALLWPQPLE